MNIVSVPGLSGFALVAVNIVRFLLVAFFAYMATTNLLGDEHMASDFARWGYSDGFRRLTAVLQGGAAVLLIFPGTAFGGSLLLTGILLGAVGTHLMHDPPAALISPAVFLLLTGVVLFSHRPEMLRAGS